MSNYIDSAQVGGTDYPIRVPNGVTYRNPSAMTPSTNPLIRRNDLVQTLSNDEDNPPSSKAVKTVTDSLNSDLAYKLARTCTDSTIYTFPSGAKEVIFVAKYANQMVSAPFPIGVTTSAHTLYFGCGMIFSQVQINDNIYRFTSYNYNGTEYIGNGATLEVWYR